MKSTSLLLIVGLVLGFAACKPAADTLYKKNGISFNVPHDWKISEESKDDKKISINVEKKGTLSSGLLGISCILDNVSTEQMLDIYRSLLKENPTYRNGTVAEPQQGKFSKYEATVLPFDFSVSDIKHKGKFYFFHHNKKSFTILVQEAVEDSKNNAPGFATIEKTFVLE